MKQPSMPIKNPFGKDLSAQKKKEVEGLENLVEENNSRNKEFDAGCQFKKLPKTRQSWY